MSTSQETAQLKSVCKPDSIICDSMLAKNINTFQRRINKS